MGNGSKATEGLTLAPEGLDLDETDARLVLEAVTFLANPTEDYEDIAAHTRSIGEVQSGYEMNGEECPPEIDAIAIRLWILQCENRIKLVEEELLKESPDSQRVEDAMTWAGSAASILSRGYKDPIFLARVGALRSAITAKKASTKVHDEISGVTK